MTADAEFPAPAERYAYTPVPNNLGATLLLALGLLTAPLIIGLPLMILGLAKVRSADGALALPHLAGSMRRLRRGINDLSLAVRRLATRRQGTKSFRAK